MVWNRIPSVCLYFCSMERNSELLSLPWNGSERYSEHFSPLRNGSKRNSENFLFRGTAGIPPEQTNCSIYFFVRNCQPRVDKWSHTWTLFSPPPPHSALLHLLMTKLQVLLSATGLSLIQVPCTTALWSWPQAESCNRQVFTNIWWRPPPWSPSFGFSVPGNLWFVAEEWVKGGPGLQSGGKFRSGAVTGWTFKRQDLVLGSHAVMRIHAVFVWIRIRGSMPLTNGSGSGQGVDPDTSIFIVDLQDANKKLI